MPLINNTVLMSDANHFSTEQPINPYYHQDPINIATAIDEHAEIRKLLTQAGIKVIKVPSPTDCQDGVYTANWALVRGNKAVLARLPNARVKEETYAEKVLTSLGKKVVHVPNNLKFSGQGDALACGEYLFCGSGYRSDKAAQKFAAEQLGYTRIQLHTVPQQDLNGDPITNSASGWPDSFFYDLDLALAIIKQPTKDKKGLIAYCAEAFDKKSCQLLEELDAVNKIEVSVDEAKQAFATNLVSTGETVVMSAHAPEFTKQLRQQGLIVLTPEITELAKGGGYIRCVTLTLD
jgi:N-dimethylarginine dimethylaminohydrolase